MEYTKNYNLKKPSEEDFYNVNDFNSNSEIVDTELKKLDQIIKILQDGINAAELLKKIKEIDGPGSGLDADTVHGLNAGYSPTNSYIPIVNDSILEIGRTIDFHIQNSTQDFDARMFIDANFLPAWHIPNQTVKRIPLADGTLQTNLNADLLDGKDSSYFARTGFGNGGEVCSNIGTGIDVLNIKNENANYINGNFMGYNLLNVPTGDWYFIKQLVHNDSFVVIQALQFTDINAKWIENRKWNGRWQGWKEAGGGNLFTVPRSFEVSNPTAGQTVFSYSGSGEVITTHFAPNYDGFNSTPILVIDGVELNNGYFPYSSSAPYLQEIRISFKNSIVIKTRVNQSYCKGLVMTEK